MTLPALRVLSFDYSRRICMVRIRQDKIIRLFPVPFRIMKFAVAMLGVKLYV